MTVLMTVGNATLAVPAGLSYNRMLAAGAPRGGVTSSFRDPVHQAYLRAQYLAGVPGYNFALPPEKSKHCQGLALDLAGDVNNVNTPRGWFAKHGTKYGWYPVSNEAWHFEYRANQDPSIPKKENDMPNRLWFNRSKDQALAPGKWKTVQLNDKGDISVAIGAKDLTANVWVQVNGLPIGSQIQGRFYIVDVKNGKTVRVNTLSRTLTEFIGTDGSTFLRFGAITGLTPTQRLRAEVWVETASTNAKIVNAGADALTWN